MKKGTITITTYQSILLGLSFDGFGWRDIHRKVADWLRQKRVNPGFVYEDYNTIAVCGVDQGIILDYLFSIAEKHCYEIEIP